MNRDLPKVYANKIDKKIDNLQEVFYERKDTIDNNKSIKDKINEIFNSSDFVYKKDVKIVIDDKTIYKTIVGINNGYLLTMDNERIDINKIKNISVNH